MLLRACSGCGTPRSCWGPGASHLLKAASSRRRRSATRSQLPLTHMACVRGLAGLLLLKRMRRDVGLRGRQQLCGEAGPDLAGARVLRPHSTRVAQAPSCTAAWAPANSRERGCCCLLLHSLQLSQGCEAERRVGQCCWQRRRGALQAPGRLIPACCSSCREQRMLQRLVMLVVLTPRTSRPWVRG